MNSKSNFNKEMLKDARIYRGMSIKDLAEKTNISRQTISQYENGDILQPNLENLFKISGVLNFSINYFFNTKKDLNNYNTYFRALLSSNKKQRQIQELKVEKTFLVYRYLKQFLDFPKLEIIQKEPKNENDIEKIALELRNYWGLGLEPIKNMINLLEKKGIIITSFNTNNSDIDAFSKKFKIDNEEYYCMVLGNDKKSAVRRQFCAAHELGHIIMHDWNENLEDISNEEFRKREKEANYFAAAFLMPKETFLKDLIYEKNLNFYVELKKKWRVSISAMIMRAYNLKVLNENQYQYLIKKISYNGWRNEEPLDDIIQKEEPKLFKRSIDLLVDNSIISKSEIVNNLREETGLDREEIENLISVPDDTLLEIKVKKPENDNIVILPKRKTSNS